MNELHQLINIFSEPEQKEFRQFIQRNRHKTERKDLDLFNHLSENKLSKSKNIHEEIYELKDKTIGIVGLGDIGKQVAIIAKAFGAEVIYFSTSGQNTNAEYTRVSWEELLSKSDIITIHAPLNEQTKGVFNYDALSKMKNTAIIHNAGRGGIIVEEDLCRALNENKISSAALDVYEQEPLPLNSCLLNASIQQKLILTPHTAWAAKESRERLVEGILKNIEEVLNK